MSTNVPPTQLIMPNRGDVWTVHLAGVGREQQGTRPVVIISDNRLNHSGFRLVIAAPVTSNTARYASRVYLDPPEGGLTQQSAIMCEQILRLDIDNRLVTRTGTVTQKTLDSVCRTLITILAID